jgi:type I restriction enzyme S subunit
MDGAAITRVTLVKIKNFVIPVPPLSEQQTIVATLDSLKSKVDRLQANYDKISQECDALKQAILKQVFE